MRAHSTGSENFMPGFSPCLLYKNHRFSSSLPATTFFFRSRCAAADETIGDQLGFEASLEPPVPFASPQLYFKQPGELVLPSEYMSAAAAVADLDPSFLLKPAVQPTPTHKKTRDFQLGWRLFFLRAFLLPP